MKISLYIRQAATHGAITKRTIRNITPDSRSISDQRICSLQRFPDPFVVDRRRQTSINRRRPADPGKLRAAQHQSAVQHRGAVQHPKGPFNTQRVVPQPQTGSLTHSTHPGCTPIGPRNTHSTLEHKKELKPVTDFWQTMGAYLQVPSFESYSGSTYPRSNSNTFTWTSEQNYITPSIYADAGIGVATRKSPPQALELLPPQVECRLGVAAWRRALSLVFPRSAACLVCACLEGAGM